MGTTKVTEIVNKVKGVFTKQHNNKSDILLDYCYRITPTEKEPIFQILDMKNNNVISSENLDLDDWLFFSGRCPFFGKTSAVSFTEAIQVLSDYLNQNKEKLSDDQEFIIEMIDGTTKDGHRDIKRTKCFSITVDQAKRFRIINKL